MRQTAGWIGAGEMDQNTMYRRGVEIAESIGGMPEDRASILAAALVWVLLDLSPEKRLAHTLAHLEGLRDAGVLTAPTLSECGIPKGELQ
jgi:hypothetical protein